MKTFTTLTVNGEEYEGLGYYDNNSNEIQIEAVDHIILSVFRKAIRDNTKINDLSFTGGDSNASFGGRYLVINVQDNAIQLIKG